MLRRQLLGEHWNNKNLNQNPLGISPVDVEISSDFHQLSNETKNPGWLGYIGDEILRRLYRDFDKTNIRIPISSDEISWRNWCLT